MTTEINKEELAKLFSEYEEADKEWEKKKAAVEESYRFRSDAVKAIAKMIAPQRKIRFRGQELTIVSREHKDDTNVVSWFFRGGSKKDLIDIG